MDTSDQIRREMLAMRESQRCFSPSALDEVWPKLSEGQQQHLENCASCQGLVRKKYPYLYLGPSRKMIEAIKHNPAEEWLLTDWKQEASGRCISLDEFQFDRLTVKQVRHVEKCRECRKLIRFLSHHGGIFATPFSAVGELHRLVKMNVEIGGHTCYRNTRNQAARQACADECLNTLDVGPDKIILVPRSDHINEHGRYCLHCQLVLSYYEANQNRTLFEHYDYETWQYFPVYHSEDQLVIEQHLRECIDCQEKAFSRLIVNLSRDRAQFETFKRPLLLALPQSIRKVKQLWGEWVSSWRFHFGPDGPFGLKHPWAIFSLHDRMAKIFNNQGLTELEVTYRNAVNTTEPLASLEQKLREVLQKES